MPSQNSYFHFLYRQLFTTPRPVLPYNPHSSAPNAVRESLDEKTALITGSNSGLGYQAASQLLGLGLSKVILAVRDMKKGEAARESFLQGCQTLNGSKPRIEVWELDMASYSSITSFTERVKREKTHIDFAILNAGVAKVAFEERDGREITILTNWLGTALLAMTLRPILQAQYASKGPPSGHPPVLSIVGSEVAQWAKFKEAKIAEKAHTRILPQLNDPKNFDMSDRYYTSKLLLMLFFVEFSAQIDEKGDNDVIVNLVNPGFCYGSELHASLTGVLGKIFGAVKRMMGRSTEVGARTLVHAAVAAGVESHGRFLSDEQVFPMANFVASEKGPQMARRLWEEMREELKV